MCSLCQKKTRVGPKAQSRESSGLISGAGCGMVLLMIRLFLLSLAVGLPGFFLFAQQGMEALDEHKRVGVAAAGVYDMSEEPRKYPFLLILEQDALRFSSFWAGRHDEGEVTFDPKTDMLSGGLNFNAEGGFTLRVTQSARKLGMENVVPGGPWMKDTRERNFTIHFESFRDAEVGEVEGRRGSGTVEVVAKAKGRVEVDGKRAPVEAEVRFVFKEETPHFTFHAEFTFTGASLGLKGDQAGPIRAKVSTLSPLGKPPPAPTMEMGVGGGADDGLMDLDF